MKSSGQRTSDLLLSAIEQMEKQESLTLEEILTLLQGRGFGLLIVLFCIPNCLPIPNIAALSAVTGIPIIIMGLEMLAGRTHLWLPSVLGKKPVPSRKLAKLLAQAIPGIRTIEKLLHPRLLAISDPVATRLLSAAFVLLAIVMSLPIPFTNMLPGWAMALMAIGLIERDGALILAGVTIGVVTLLLVFTLTHSVLDLANLLLDNF